MDVGGEDNSVVSPLLLKSTPFYQGEKVLACFRGGIHEAKVLQVGSQAKTFYVHYSGFSKKLDEWVGVYRLMKYNKQNQKAPVEENPLEKFKDLQLKHPNVTTCKKRKTIPKDGTTEGWAENKFAPHLFLYEGKWNKKKGNLNYS
ncbi:hypothetical protein L1887_20388 [Cichorium endivia]|nr:hypothetical protein L1887_20388 [Cichorium endivia]